MGIDLGTTNSCVAIPTDEEGGPDIMVVTDSHGRFTIPSVVYKTAEGEYLVGSKAKQKMGSRPEPVAFVKRYMGKDHRVKLRDEDLTPEQVSAIILRHLKSLVKERLGDEITQAVITIPARFELPGQQATVEAARLAGIEVLTTMPEPVAAALAYGLQDADDKLKIFCYDLGGGTFDATVMTKNPETGIEVLAFDGDAHLGGYNFDTEFAKWILQQLNRKYSLKLDWENPNDLAIFQKLMRVAEAAKIELTKEPEYTISEKEIFEDHEGEVVDIELEITRGKYEEMILPMIEQTLEISERAIAKAGLTPDQIDRVILVGGSSRMPMVKRLLAERLKCSPELADPDRIVARGAAIKAGTMVGGRVEGLVFLTEVPKICALESFDIHAQVTLENCAGARVNLQREDGGYKSQTVTDSEGKFGFTDVELMEEEENHFELTVGDPASPLLTHKLVVVQHPESVETDLGSTNFVTQDISLVLANGLEPVFVEGKRIPDETTNVMKTLGTQSDDQTFAVFKVCHGNHELGEVRFPDLPPGLPKHSEILVGISLNDKLEVSGRAAMVRTNQTINFVFRIPKPKLPDIGEMEQRYKQLKNDFSDAIEHIGDNTLKMKNYGEGQRKMREIEAEFANRPADLPKLFRLIDEFGVFIGLLAKIDVLEPPWANFQSRLEDTRHKAKQAEGSFEKARRANFRAAIDGVERFGDKAYQEKNKEAWQHANQQIERIASQIMGILQEEEVEMAQNMIGALPPEQRAAIFRERLQQQLLELDSIIGANPRLDRRKPKLRELINELNRVNTNQPEKAFETMMRINTGIEELERLLQNDRDGGVVKI
jgi:actin-like ATPase involved in cell morphogenesis